MIILSNPLVLSLSLNAAGQPLYDRVKFLTVSYDLTKQCITGTLVVSDSTGVHSDVQGSFEVSGLGQACRMLYDELPCTVHPFGDERESSEQGNHPLDSLALYAGPLVDVRDG